MAPVVTDIIVETGAVIHPMPYRPAPGANARH